MLSGCSYTAQISEDDERLRVCAGTEYGDQYSMLGAWAAVYKGKYDIIEVPEELNIVNIVAPVGKDNFVVARRTDKGGEYGIYSLNGEYRTILLQRYTDNTENTASFIITCNEEYALYYTANINEYGAISLSDVELHLLKLDDLTDKRIRILDSDQFSGRAVICDNAVYFEQHISADGIGAYEGKYSKYAIIRYDIETEKLEKYCVNAGRPAIYKNKPTFFIGDGKLVSYVEPLFEPAEHGLDMDAFLLSPSGEMAYSYYKSNDGGYSGYDVMGYIKDGKPFDILAIGSVFGIEDVYFSDGCAVWSNHNGYYDANLQTLPMFYSEKRNSVVVVDYERAYYESFINKGKICFFGYDGDRVNRQLRRVLILDTDKI
ncbi:MAG: hypothetical protein K1W18_07310 [Oscillospiraceae bacterium]